MYHTVYISENDYSQLKNVLTVIGKLIFTVDQVKQEEEHERNFDKIAAELRQIHQKSEGTQIPPLENDKIGFLKFTNKEILKMPAKFKKYFIANDRLVRVRRRKRSKHGYTFEARYRRDGYNISVSSTNPDKLPEKFIAALHAIGNASPLPNVPNTFDEFSTYYFDTFWKRTVKPSTYKTEMNRYKNHIRPFFGSLPIKKITPAMCQKLFDDISNKGLGKTLDEVHTRLNQIFDMAINHGIIKINPLCVTIFRAHERKHGKALTKDEEKHLLEVTAGTPYQLMFAVALYTGLRPGEFKTARIDGEFIVALNSKQKNNKVDTKRIPITPMLRQYLEGVQELRFYVPQRIREKFRSILPNHSLKDTRATFFSRCIVCGVSKVALKKFMGHSLGKVSDAYADLPDEYYIKEGNKLSY